MKKRLTRITTRTGDDGTTGLADGQRVPKTGNRIAAIGSLDELNSALGLLRATETNPATDAVLDDLQHALFDLGGELALPGRAALSQADVVLLEQRIDALNAALPPLVEFVLPGGNEAAARCHLARTICRRAEADLWRLAEDDDINPFSLKFLNRLSDLLFVLARGLARQDGGTEVVWRRNR